MSKEILIALILYSICMLIAIVATEALEPKTTPLETNMHKDRN